MFPTSEELREQGLAPNFVVVVLHGEQVMHLTVYENEPTEDDIAHLGEELQFDEEIGLTHLNVEEMTYLVLTEKGYEEFLQDVEYEEVPASTVVQ